MSQVYLRAVKDKRPIKIKAVHLGEGGRLERVESQYTSEQDASRMSQEASMVFVEFFCLGDNPSEIEMVDVDPAQETETLHLTAVTSKQIVGETRRRLQRAEAARRAAEPLKSGGESDLATGDMFPGSGKDALFSKKWSI